MSKKYELTGETKEHNGRVLHRIKALRDIPRHEIFAGALGGWLETENNLSHDGDAWVGEDAIVYQNALVSDGAYVGGMAKVLGNAQVYDHAEVSGAAVVRDCAYIRGRALVCGSAVIAQNAHIAGLAKVSGNARVEGDALVFDSAKIEKGGLVKRSMDYMVFFDGAVGDTITAYRTEDNAVRWAYGLVSLRGQALVECVRQTSNAEVAARVEKIVEAGERILA